MANIKLLDTGYVSNKDLSGQTQIVPSLRAGFDGTSDVVSFTLKSAALGRSRQVNNENKPVVDTLQNPQTTLVSTGSTIIAVNAVLQNDLSSTAYDINELVQLDRLDSTRGLKLLYVDSTTDVKKTIVEGLGEVNINGVFADASPADTDGTVSTATPYLVGRIRNLRINEPVDSNFYRIAFDFEITG